MKDISFLKKNYKLLLKENKNKSETSYLDGNELKGKKNLELKEELQEIHNEYKKTLADYLLVEIAFRRK